MITWLNKIFTTHKRDDKKKDIPVDETGITLPTLNWESLIEVAKKEHNRYKVDIILAAKAYIEADHAMWENPCGWKSCHGPKEDPIWAEYYKLRDTYQKASSHLWMMTDMEFAEDGFRNFVWEWRYWKVMARKCCYYQLSSGNTDKAAETMRKLGEAEENFFNACGLLELYYPPQYYLEKQFPNLRSKK